MNKGVQIAPWSFYNNDPNVDNTQSNVNTNSKENPFPIEGLRNQKFKKNFSAINIERINKITSTNKQKSIRKMYSLDPYCHIISTSQQLISTKQQTIDLNDRLILLMAIKECLRSEKKQKQSKTIREKYQCLFPILKPRDSLKKKYKIIRMQYPSQILVHKLLANSYIG